jgi:hypothetical protein
MWPVLWDWVENNVSSFAAIEKKFIACSLALQAKMRLMSRINVIYDIAKKPNATAEHICPGNRLSAE